MTMGAIGASEIISLLLLFVGLISLVIGIITSKRKDKAEAEISREIFKSKGVVIGIIILLVLVVKTILKL